MRKLIYIVAAALALGACSEETIPVYDGSRSYVYFTEDSTEITRFSFKTVPGQTEYTVSLPVEIVGVTPTQTLGYKLSVDPARTTAPAEAYELDPDPVNQAGRNEGTTIVTGKKVLAMDERELDIAVRIVEGGAYLPGPTTNVLHIIRVSNIISQPGWWNDDFANAFLGTYTDEKYEEFIKATQVSDLTDMDNSQIASLCRQFVYYLREKKDNGEEVFEKDGTPMLDGININA